MSETKEEPQAEIIDTLPDVAERMAELEKGLVHHDAEELQNLKNRGIFQEKSGAKLELEKHLKADHLGRAITHRVDADNLRDRGILLDQDPEEHAHEREEITHNLEEALSHRPAPEEVEEKMHES